MKADPSATAVEKVRSDFRDGMSWLVADYFEKLRTPETNADDLRKAIELGFKALGMNVNEKVETLQTVNWVINGGNVTLDIQAPPPSLDVPTQVIDDVTPKVKKAPEKEVHKVGTLSFDIVDNMLDTL